LTVPAAAVTQVQCVVGDPEKVKPGVETSSTESTPW
jgi:hypothetical protein